MKQYWIGSSGTKTAKEPKQNTAEVEAERESETKETEKTIFRYELILTTDLI